DHRRNLSDDMLRAVAKTGGLTMVNFWSLFLSNEFGAAQRAFWEKNAKPLGEIRAKYKSDPLAARVAYEKLRAENEPLPKVPLSALVDHIDHVVKIAGIDHVGLGSDFDGGNFLRAFEKAEEYAKSTGTSLSGDGSQQKIDRP